MSIDPITVQVASSIEFEWGSVPDWVEAGGTALAFVVAAVAYSRDVKNRREAQARLVYSKLTHIEDQPAGAVLAQVLPEGVTQGVIAKNTGTFVMPATMDDEATLTLTGPTMLVRALVHNGSAELIGPVKLQIVDTGRNCNFDEFCATNGFIEPGSNWEVEFTFPNPFPAGQPSLGSTVIYRDASGSWWRRHLAQSIEHVHEDPENSLHMPAMRAQYAENAIMIGGTPSPEPTVNRRVRWHRYWRTKRGKSPIP